MKTQTSKTLKLVIAAAAALLTPILAGANLPHKILRSDRAGQPAAATPASSQYRFVTFGTPGVAGGAYGVNNPGLVTGSYTDAAGDYHGFLWQNGELRTVDYPGAPYTLLGDVTDGGLVIGNYGDVTTQHAVTYDTRRATWTTLPDIPGQPQNYGNGINNSGVGTGAACSGNFVVTFNCVGWTWDEGSYSFFTAPHADQTFFGTFPNGINNRGQVAGYFQDASSVYHGFLKDGHSFATINVPAASNTFAYDINDSGEIVGYYDDTTGTPHGFVQDKHGQFTTVDVPGAVATFISGNDDRGDLAGYFVDSSGAILGFVAFKK